MFQGAPDMPMIHSTIGCCICRLILVAVGTMDSKATIKAVSRDGSRYTTATYPLLSSAHSHKLTLQMNRPLADDCTCKFALLLGCSQSWKY